MVNKLMDSGMALANDFPSKYRTAIYPQYTIRWNIVFYGKISQEWLKPYN